MKLQPIASGKSVEGQEIKAFISNPNLSSSFLYLLAGVHGDEIEGIHILKELILWIESQKELHLPLIIIPTLNIDGFKHQTRVNANQVDLNRNLPTIDWSHEFSEAQYNPGPTPLSEPENSYLVQLFKQFPPYMAISFHSWKPLLNYNGDCKHIAEFLERYNQYPLADDVGYGTPGSLGTYLPELYNAPVLTFEAPRLHQGPTLEQIWEENREGLINLLQSELLNSSQN